MLQSALVVLALISFATSEPPPAQAPQNYASHSGYPGGGKGSYPGSQQAAGYRGPGTHQIGYNTPSQVGYVQHVQGHAAGGNYGGGQASPAQEGAYAGFRAGLLQGISSSGGILNSLFGWAGNGPQKPHAQVSNNGGYNGYTHPKPPGGSLALGSSYNYDSAKGGMGGFSFGLGNPQNVGGVRPFGAPKPMPTVHDDNRWIPIKSAPVDVVLNQPAEEYGLASSRSSMSITPSMSYGYSYKLIPTFAYGPTLSGGQSRYGR